MNSTASTPNSVTKSGPSTANPSANEAWSVKVNSPLALISSPRLTTMGIIAASAGPKNVVRVATKIVNR